MSAPEQGVWGWVHDEDCRIQTDDHSEACARRSATLMAFIQRHRDAALAAARAESDALRAALTEAIAEAYCPTTAGGTEGKWCLNHDTPMVTPAICAMVEGWMAALAGGSRPGAPVRTRPTPR